MKFLFFFSYELMAKDYAALYTFADFLQLLGYLDVSERF